jgi:EpsD family peptidyl-prolyl cis-trans isomerase
MRVADAGPGLAAQARPRVHWTIRNHFAIVPRLDIAWLELRRIALLHITAMSRRRWRIAAIACALPAAMLLAGCGKKQEAQAVVGQVIAHVGPDDVTQQELDNELRLANVPADKRSDEVLKGALSRIVERKYLVQQALAAKLDREPTVHLDLLRAHEQILAGAFVQRDLSGKMSAVSKNEIDSYIQGHPKQFDQRELFQIDQISFTAPKDVEALSAATKDFKSLDQVEAKLNEMNVKFSRGTATLDSATMPAEMLKVLDARKADDIYFVRSRGSASFFKVSSVDPKPMTGDQANEFAKREVRVDIGRKGAEAISKAALADSKFEGDYARIMTTAAPGAPAPAPATEGEAPAGAPPTPEPPASDIQKEQPKN